MKKHKLPKGIKNAELLRKLLLNVSLDCQEPTHPADAEEAIAFMVARSANDEDTLDQGFNARGILRETFGIAQDDDTLDQILQIIADRANELANEREPYIAEIAKIIASRMDISNLDEDGHLDDQALDTAIVAAPVKIRVGSKEFVVTHKPHLHAVEVTPQLRIRLHGVNDGCLSVAVITQLRERMEE